MDMQRIESRRVSALFRGWRRLMVASMACTLSIAIQLCATSVAGAHLVRLGPCDASVLSQPFVAWGDPFSYVLAPKGDFESAGWTLGRAANIVPGSEPFAATGKLGAVALSLPAGGSALSPSTCVDAGYSTIRMFIAGSGIVRVDVVAHGLAVPAGVAVAAGGWQPTPVMVTDAAVVATQAGGTASVSLLLTGVSGSPRVDDVFIDPWNRG
ncbi:MAG TPA: hypothetical protein VHW04_05920 [Solirubrobacteraceae bacterium]|jgi:hypothetical protein|nr:hypothetical protein [Solirubrobacteraceae bacterium]